MAMRVSVRALGSPALWPLTRPPSCRARSQQEPGHETDSGSPITCCWSGSWAHPGDRVPPPALSTSHLSTRGREAEALVLVLALPVTASATRASLSNSELDFPVCGMRGGGPALCVCPVHWLSPDMLGPLTMVMYLSHGWSSPLLSIPSLVDM